jgi:hypothetical protein
VISKGYREALRRAAAPLRPRRKNRTTHVDAAYIPPYVDSANLNGDAAAVEHLEAKMVLFGLVFLTMTIIATLYFT